MIGLYIEFLFTRTNVKSTREQILHGLDVDSQRLEVLKLDVTGTVSPILQLWSNFPLTFFPIRRKHHLRGGVPLQISLLIQLPPPRLLHPWHPPSREVPLPDRLCQSPLDVPSQHAGSPAPLEVLFAPVTSPLRDP